MRELLKICAAYALIASKVDAMLDAAQNFVVSAEKSAEIVRVLGEVRDQVGSWPRSTSAAIEDKVNEILDSERWNLERQAPTASWSEIKQHVRPTLRPKVAEALREAEKNLLSQVSDVVGQLGHFSASSARNYAESWLNGTTSTHSLASQIAHGIQTHTRTEFRNLANSIMATGMKNPKTNVKSSGACYKPSAASDCNWVPAALRKELCVAFQVRWFVSVKLTIVETAVATPKPTLAEFTVVFR